MRAALAPGATERYGKHVPANELDQLLRGVLPPIGDWRATPLRHAAVLCPLVEIAGEDQVLFVDLGPTEGRGERVISALGQAYVPFDSPCIVV